MDFTSTGKGDIESDFVSKEEMSFLKRKFVYHEELARYVAPLDISSIYKTLHWVAPSKSVNLEVQYASIIESVLRELVFHIGRETFESVREKLLICFFNKLDIFDSAVLLRDFVTYDYIIDSLQINAESNVCDHIKKCDVCQDRIEDYSSRIVIGRAEKQSMDNVSISQENLNCSPVKCVCPCSGCKDPRDINREHNSLLWRDRLRSYGMFIQPQDFTRELLDWKVNLEKELKEAMLDLEAFPAPVPDAPVLDMRNHEMYFAHTAFREDVEKYVKLVARVREIGMTQSLVNEAIHRVRRRERLVSESFVEAESHLESVQRTGPVDPSTIDVEQNVTDMGGEQSDYTSVGVQHPSSLLRYQRLHSDNFLSRPVEILSQTLALSTDYNIKVDVWATFLNIPAIRAKLKNYAFLYGTMNVKVAIAGTPFHFGRILVSYVPQFDDNEVCARYFTATGTGANHRSQYIRWQSQHPGAKEMDPRDNTPLVMKLPFMSHKDTIRLFNDSALILSDVTNYADTTNLGALLISTLNQIKADTAAPSTVHLYVYAWMTDVVLGCPTATNVTITAESQDERKTGPVESFASKSVEVTSALSRVPFLKPFADPATMVLEGIRGLAAHYGFSTPVIDVKPNRVKNEPLQNEANLIGCDTGKKISLDPLQSLTLGQEISGTLCDELSLSYICARESLLSSFNWSTAAATMVPLWYAAVTPRSMNYTLPVAKKYCQPSSLMYAATPFQYWRGSITYRIEIVCSNFHRGKLVIGFDPNIAQSALINANPMLNKQYLKIIDLEETDCVEFTVNWANARNWLRNCDSTRWWKTISTSGTYDPSVLSDYANGFIFIYPLVQLQSPTAATAYVNVFIKSTNMKFNTPIESELPTDMVWAESNIEDQTLCLNTVTNFDLNEPNSEEKGIYDHHFGESISSFRALMHRFVRTYTSTMAGDAANSYKYYVFGQNIIPALLPSTVSTLGSASPNIFNYLRYAFVGMRGGLRKRIRVLGLGVGDTNAHLKVGINAPRASALVPYNGVSASSAPTSFVGVVTFVTSTNAGVEVELPFYSPNMYVTSGSVSPFDVTDTQNEKMATRDYTVYCETTGAQAGSVQFVEETAIGDDFNFFKYIGAVPFAQA